MRDIRVFVAAIGAVIAFIGGAFAFMQWTIGGDTTWGWILLIGGGLAYLQGHVIISADSKRSFEKEVEKKRAQMRARGEE